MERAVFERMAELGSVHWWFVARGKILAEVVRRYARLPADEARILEVGCGPGHNLAMLQRFGSVDACELDPFAREIATERLGKPVASVKLPQDIPFDDATYDLVALLDVLEHVDDDLGSLRRIRSLLKPGGALLLTVPANPWMFGAHDVAHHHKRRYRKGEIDRLAREAGFAIELLSPFNTLLFPFAAAVRLAQKWSSRETADDSLPPRPVNAIFRRIFEREAGLVGRIPFPFGVSIVAVLRRPA